MVVRRFDDDLAGDSRLADLRGIVEKDPGQGAQAHEATEIARGSIEMWFHLTFLRDRVMPLFHQMGRRKILQAPNEVNRG